MLGRCLPTALDLTSWFQDSSEFSSGGLSPEKMGRIFSTIDQSDIRGLDNAGHYDRRELASVSQPGSDHDLPAKMLEDSPFATHLLNPSRLPRSTIAPQKESQKLSWNSRHHGLRSLTAKE